jgi:subfamily B ATP-binding cassette protein MsbA
MLPFARRYWGRIVLSLVLVIVANLVQLTLPLAIRQLLDKMTKQQDPSGLHIVAAAMIAIFIVRSIINFVGQYNLQITGDRITNELRVKLLSHYQDLPLSYHYNHRIGDFISRMYSGAPEVRNVVTNLAVSGTANIVQLVGASLVMIYINLKLALVVLCLCPLTSIVARLFGPVFRKVSADIKDALASAMAFAQESLAGTYVVKIFAADRSQIRRFEKMMHEYLEKAAAGRRADAAYGAIITLLTVVSTIVLFWFGGLQILSGAMTVGSLIAFFLYSQNVNQNINSLAQLYSSASQSIGASEKIFEILRESVEESDQSGKKIFDAPRATIEFKNVEFRYHESIPVLDDISFIAAPGETVAILGRSGIGKSSLLGLIPRFYSPMAGQILINGVDIQDYSLTSLRHGISVVSQDIFLFSATVLENIRFGRHDATDAEIEGAAKSANAHDFIIALKDSYQTQVGERGVQLSGGQRQRIAIARAILRNSPILLLDEATSAVDDKTDLLIHEALARLTHDRTTLVVAHRSATIASADQVIDLAKSENAIRINEVTAA